MIHISLRSHHSVFNRILCYLLNDVTIIYHIQLCNVVFMLIVEKEDICQ